MTRRSPSQCFANMKASEGKARVRPVQSKAKEGPKSVPSPSSLKRSGTVEGLLGNTEQENVHFNDRLQLNF